MKIPVKTMILLGFCFLAVPAQAYTIAECSSSKGYSYFPAVAPNPKYFGDFSSDAFSDGRISLDLRDDGTFDILFSDHNEPEKSSLSEGAKVIRIGQGPASITIAVIYPRLSEVYTFLQTRSGPEVMWSTNKFLTPVAKVGAYMAVCTSLDLP